MIARQLIAAALAAALITSGCGDSDDSSSRAVVWAVGDGATGAPEATRLAEMIAEDDPGHFLYLGDVYDTGTAAEFESKYEPAYGRFDEIAAPTAGDHEWANREEGYFPYWEAAQGERPANFYSFRAAGWDVIGLNSEAPHEEDSSQVRQLRDHLDETPEYGTCRIAFWHRPRYSAGLKHGDLPDVEPLWDALEGHATATLHGNEHNMQRLQPRRGITEFISGAGDPALATPLAEDDPRLAFGEDERYGALRLVLEHELASWTFVGADGAELDSGRLTCATG